MLDDRIIVLIGPTHRQVDYWKKAIFSYDEIKTLKIVEAYYPFDLFGYRDGWYILVGEWEKMHDIHEFHRMLIPNGFKQLDLIFEEQDAI